MKFYEIGFNNTNGKLIKLGHKYDKMFLVKIIFYHNNDIFLGYC
jgi:hypothetical protein